MSDTPKPLRMYIFVKATLPSHKMVAVAHGVLMAHLKFYDADTYYNKWLSNSFRKVVCEITDEEFEIAKKESDCVVVTESGLQNQEVALVFCPRPVWPSYFKKFKFSPY